jgi:hypothetical protein
MGAGGQSHASIAVHFQKPPLPLYRRLCESHGVEYLAPTGIRSQTAQHVASRYTYYAISDHTKQLNTLNIN